MSQWTMTDLVTSATYTFSFNPNRMDPVMNPKALESLPHLTSPRTWKSRTAPREWTFSGTCRGQQTHLDLLDWFTRKHELQITDHLGRTFKILPKEIEFRERRSRHEPWKFDYTVRGLLTEQALGGIG